MNDLPKKSTWEAMDRPLQRTAWVVAIVVGILTLFNNFILPYYEAWLVGFQFALVFWNIYCRITQKNYFVYWSNQPVFLTSLVFCLFEANLFIIRSAPNYGLRSALWFLAAVGWLGLFYMATYDRHKFYEARHQEVWDAMAKMVTLLDLHAVNNERKFERIAGVTTDQVIAVEVATPRLEASDHASEKLQTEQTAL